MADWDWARSVNPKDPTPLHAQLERSIRVAIGSRHLRPATSCPRFVSWPSPFASTPTPSPRLHASRTIRGAGNPARRRHVRRRRTRLHPQSGRARGRAARDRRRAPWPTPPPTGSQPPTSAANSRRLQKEHRRDPQRRVSPGLHRDCRNRHRADGRYRIADVGRRRRGHRRARGSLPRVAQQWERAVVLGWVASSVCRVPGSSGSCRSSTRSPGPSTSA